MKVVKEVLKARVKWLFVIGALGVAYVDDVRRGRRLLDAELDLSMVRFKLANPEEGEAWSQQTMDLAEAEYRKCLAVCIAYPDEAIVPCRLVDQFKGPGHNDAKPGPWCSDGRDLTSLRRLLSRHEAEALVDSLK